MYKGLLRAVLVVGVSPALADMSETTKKAMPQVCHNRISSNIQAVASGQMLLVSGTKIHPFDVKGKYGMKLEYLSQTRTRFASTYMCVFDDGGVVEDVYGVDFKEYEEGQARVMMNLGERYREAFGIK